MAEYMAVCHDCDWEQPMPERDMAEHAKKVHEDRYGHNVTLDVGGVGAHGLSDTVEMFEVTTQSGSTYVIDLQTSAGECLDARYGDRTCKHQLRIAFKNGDQEIPGWVDSDDAHWQLGEHISRANRGGTAERTQVNRRYLDASTESETSGHLQAPRRRWLGPDYEGVA